MAAGAGVQRPLVERDVEDVGVGVEHLLGAVAVVRVDVDDRHALAARSELGRDDRDVVQQAEAHRLARTRVVAGRTDRQERAVGVARDQRVDGREPGTGGGARRRPRPLRRRRVGVEVAAPCADRLEPVEVRGRVHPFELGAGGLPASERDEVRAEIGEHQPRVDGPEPLGPLGVTGPVSCSAKRLSVASRSTAQRYRRSVAAGGPGPALDRSTGIDRTLTRRCPTTRSGGPAAGHGSDPGGASTTSRISPSEPTARPPPRSSTVACARCAVAGTDRVLTNALAPAEALPFVDAGFSVHERLHLLAHDLADVPEADHDTRRARPDDHDAVLALDHRAFRPFWRLDRDGLEQALDATPATRFRVVEVPEGLLGYAVTGRAERRGYLQRVGVDPSAQGGGVGRASSPTRCGGSDATAPTTRS